MWKHADKFGAVEHGGRYIGAVIDGIFHKCPDVPINPEVMEELGFTQDGGVDDTGEAGEEAAGV